MADRSTDSLRCGCMDQPRKRARKNADPTHSYTTTKAGVRSRSRGQGHRQPLLLPVAMAVPIRARVQPVVRRSNRGGRCHPTHTRIRTYAPRPIEFGYSSYARGILSLNRPTNRPQRLPPWPFSPLFGCVGCVCRSSVSASCAFMPHSRQLPASPTEREKRAAKARSRCQCMSVFRSIDAAPKVSFGAGCGVNRSIDAWVN
jgi:hypothetical protein